MTDEERQVKCFYEVERDTDAPYWAELSAPEKQSWTLRYRNADPARYEPEVDLVNHPPHYTGGPPCPGCGRAIECIDITRHLPFNPGNTVKYVWRRFFGRKAGESNVEGLKKAVFYLNDEIERLKAQALTDEPGSK